MAKWVLYENNRKYLTLLYRNLTNGLVHNCGELRADTPAQMVISWVLEQKAFSPGDSISFQDGTVVHTLQSTGRA